MCWASKNAAADGKLSSALDSFAKGSKPEPLTLTVRNICSHAVTVHTCTLSNRKRTPRKIQRRDRKVRKVHFLCSRSARASGLMCSETAANPLINTGSKTAPFSEWALIPRANCLDLQSAPFAARDTPRQTGYVNAGNTLGNSFVIGLSFVLNLIPTRIPRNGERPAMPAHVTPHLDRDKGPTRRRTTTHHRHWYL
jgi:hypothetical protein